ncbi:indoleamine 2,3-dioxygenase 2 [Pelobates cultripes]|uniref:Indoleamine 2,3-dioxygenase 2 n=2 Tax=Pelobates cultripes TaxID=61616 RepID=A0AAD1VZB6_PELCU|nr:indoleamine 2,3-dioxygenase 2 [Pelobates cultripes]CAH2275002.1 indoleamine 2,3-dioxygenase 2 [Pelobates cultripes]
MNSQDLANFKVEDYNISEEYGFIHKNPLDKLPQYYKPWMDIAENLTLLIETKKLRKEVMQMPQLGLEHLTDKREVILARVLLSHIVMGYVWQDGEQGAIKVLPQALAVPYYQISKVLGLPLIMVHSDFVLANWKQKDRLGTMTIENLSTIVSLPGGESLQGFVLVTLLVEVAAIPGVKAVIQAVKALLCEERQTLLQAMRDIAQSINKMGEALQLMYDYVDSDVYYNKIRIFLSGWKDNPSMPDGLIYEGASDDPLFFSGGSAAQSSVFHVYDELFGIHHQPESSNFLLKMRQYMPPAHNNFIEWVKGVPKLPEYVQRSGDLDLTSAFNLCITTLTEVRSLHIRIVSKYVTSAGARARKKELLAGSGGQQMQERGTGGSLAMAFLKSVRDTCKEGLLQNNTAADC